MEKFSKLDSKKPKKIKDEILFDNGYVKLIDYEGWSIVQESDLIVCIPYFIESNQFLVRYEYIPTFKYVEGKEYHVTVLSGGIEDGESTENALFREIEEEAGIVINEDYKPDALKPLFINKGHTNKYHGYILPLSEKDYHEVIPTGDGSEAERLSKSVKVDAKYIDSLNTSDLITDYMILKLKEYLNISDY
jgi:8-oxo-dGTP pyrophosphatase MutT (NUDIX family)